MVIVTNECRDTSGEFTGLLPPKVRELIDMLNTDNLEEVRLRKRMPLSVCIDGKNMFVSSNGALLKTSFGAYIVSKNDIELALQIITNNSLYSFEEEIKQGFVTAKGGHRIGIAGKALVENGKITGVNDIYALNFRFAKQIVGCADPIINRIQNFERVPNIIIMSQPECGKTTMLRDIARQLSMSGHKVCIVDERCEIASMCDGMSGFDVGCNTDVLDRFPKSVGMLTAIRSLSPDIIIVDEIGDRNDMNAIYTAVSCGVSVITSVHGNSEKMVANRLLLNNLFDVFDMVVTLEDNYGEKRIENIALKDDCYD